MSETNWIALSERKPTEADADLWGRILAMTTDRTVYSVSWKSAGERSDLTHFLPMPTPPLPKPVEKSQGAKDLEKAIELIDLNHASHVTAIFDGMQWARAGERKRFAQECLSTCNIVGAAQILLEKDYEVVPTNLLALHKLLTEAAEKS